ncbi:MAG: Na+-translocating ferredoxin:NAD+ oxidoreductase RnfG subunit [Porticoccus sp.]|jgi:Na+-translocating ferredoxin:NAD+ oxidoreductase RnfG subunit
MIAEQSIKVTTLALVGVSKISVTFKNIDLLPFKRKGAKTKATHVAFVFLCMALSVLISSNTHSKTYQTTPDFLSEHFNSSTLEAKSLWLTPEVKNQSSEILGRIVRGMRVRYYQEGEKTAWIFEEIGKEKPITIGILVNGTLENFHIQHVKVLAFRETRGWEVRYPSFTNQYKNVKMTSDYKLDQYIDGITGATLSVRALNKSARLALFYHQQVLTLNK